MIPKKAWYYWEGEPMSWLRQQSIETFKRLNPGWAVEKIPLGQIPIDGDSRLCRVLRSDWARYRTLATEGGLYFDTDIVFCKPIPDKWLDADTLLCAGLKRPIEHIAVMGSCPENILFTLLDKTCNQFTSGEPHNFQALGIHLANKLIELSPPSGKKTWVPAEAFVPISWECAEQIWTPCHTMSPLVMGVHWYGGDLTSQHYEQLVDRVWMEQSKSIVAMAWRSSMKSQPRPDTTVTTIMRNPDPRLLTWLSHQPDVKSAIDIGCGVGTYMRHIRSERVVGVDCWEPYVSEASSNGLDVICADVGKLSDEFLSQFNLAVMIDSLEHIEHEEGERLLLRLQKNRVSTIVFTPEGFTHNDKIDGNPWNEHKSGWSKHELEALGFTVGVVDGYHPDRKEGVVGAIFARWDPPKDVSNA